MSRYTHISRILMSIVALGMIAVIVGIPLIAAMHSHSNGNDRYTAYGMDHGDAVDAQHCGLCEFYAHYTPRDVDFRPSFTFTIPVVPLHVQLGQSNGGAPRKELYNRHPNKGPPSAHNRI